MRPKRTNTKRDFLDMTQDNMRADHNPHCRRRLSGNRPSSAAAVAKLDPKKDGDIRKFVKLLSKRTRIPAESTEPFVHGRALVEEQLKATLKSFEEKLAGVLRIFPAIEDPSLDVPRGVALFEKIRVDIQGMLGQIRTESFPAEEKGAAPGEDGGEEDAMEGDPPKTEPAGAATGAPAAVAPPHRFVYMTPLPVSLDAAVLLAGYPGGGAGRRFTAVAHVACHGCPAPPHRVVYITPSSCFCPRCRFSWWCWWWWWPQVHRRCARCLLPLLYLVVVPLTHIGLCCLRLLRAAVRGRLNPRPLATAKSCAP